MSKHNQSDEIRGLYRKYELWRVEENGDHRYQVFDPFFALRYATDPHARAALAAYADSCRGEFPQLANELIGEVTRFGGLPGVSDG